MPIEIRELVIKVKVEESSEPRIPGIDLAQVQKFVRTECKKEIKKQLTKAKQR